jgi:glutaredoxin
VPKPIILTLYTKPGCHLCEEARLAIDLVVSEVKAKSSNDIHIQLQEVNILEDEQLIARYAEEIPVLQINGETHAYWRIDKDRLGAAIEKLSLGL